MSRANLYRKQREFAKCRAHHEVGQAPRQKSEVYLEKNLSTQGCTSNKEENNSGRREPHKRSTDNPHIVVVGEPVTLSRRGDASGSTPSRFSNCVHYVTAPVGEQLKYLVWARGRPIACLAWSSAPRHLGSRDRYIGWSAEARRRNIRFLAYNTRFLILPWVTVEHLASHILARMMKRLSEDWESLYQHPIYFVETFVDPTRFRGTCYRAANWIRLGETTGRGKDDHTNRPNRSIKEVLGYPLTQRFRELLQEV